MVNDADRFEREWQQVIWPTLQVLDFSDPKVARTACRAAYVVGVREGFGSADLPQDMKSRMVAETFLAELYGVRQ